MKRFLKVFFSYIVALLRLVFLVLVLIISGTHKILFNRVEISEITVQIKPLRCDIEEMGEKLSYIDKMCMENPDLISASEDFPDDDLFFDGGDE